MKKIYFIPVVLAIAAIMMFGQGQGVFFGIQKAFGYGGGGGGYYIAPTPTPIPTITDDENGFSLMMSQWGQTGANLSADLNHDGVVDENDFSLLMANWTA